MISRKNQGILRFYDPFTYFSILRSCVSRPTRKRPSVCSPENSSADPPMRTAPYRRLLDRVFAPVNPSASKSFLSFFLLKPVFLPNLRVFRRIRPAHKQLVRPGVDRERRVQSLVNHQLFASLRVLRESQNFIKILGGLGRNQFSLKMPDDVSHPKPAFFLSGNLRRRRSFASSYSSRSRDTGIPDLPLMCTPPYQVPAVSKTSPTSYSGEDSSFFLIIRILLICCLLFRFPLARSFFPLHTLSKTPERSAPVGKARSY